MTDTHPHLTQARAHLDAATEAIVAIDDPIHRFHAADTLREELRGPRVIQAAAIKAAAAQALKDSGLTWDEVAERLGLKNRQRAQQIASGTRGGAQRRRAAKALREG